MKNKNNKENKMFAKRWFYIAVGFGVFFAIITTFIAICRNLNNNDETNSILNKEFVETEQNKTDVEKENDFNFDDFDNSNTEKFNKNKIVSDNNDDEKFEDNKEAEEDEEDEEKPETKKTSAIAKTSTKKEKFSKPVEGTILQQNSKNKHVFYKTLSDWRTHDGIDIAAKQNTPVKAIADGFVENINSDDNRWGVCVTINHQNGFKSVYKGLSEQLQVKLDQKVKKQDVIGTVGKTNKMESDLDEHLHFMLQKEDEWVDPKDYIDYE